jgi:hypothetical protein
MLRILGFLIRYTVLGTARLVLLAVALSPVVGAWLYFGYRRISCHPMFSGSDDACGAVSTMAAQHATAAGQLVLPYQEMLTQNPVEFVFVGIAVLLWTITVEMVERFWLRG